MHKFNCLLVAHSNSMHLRQVYTGFNILANRGLINLSQKISKTQFYDPAKEHHLRDARHAHLKVVFNGNLVLQFDTHDSIEVDLEYLKACDFYFKRSYSAKYCESLGDQGKKIFPYGLNYDVFPNRFNAHGLARNLFLPGNHSKLKRLASSFPFLDRACFVPRLRFMENPPDTSLSPKAIFVVRAYDPFSASDRSAEKIEERKAINDTRARCIMLLKKEFGNHFYGGFVPETYARKNYKDLLVDNKNQTSKKKYLHILAKYPISLATTGLHDSIGWKFGESIAFSKAILTEKLHFSVPSLKEGTHYLSFATPEECVTQASRLFTDHNLRKSMMIDNFKYYHAWLKPDVLILNTLLTALERSN
ncbi:MAG: hypothetical protein HC896_04945 [Bacteroidales bacterium]|nr:hypothetical protein [Bacteroidales bacterium]